MAARFRTWDDRRLITTTQGGVRGEEVLEDDAQVLAAYRTHFGITLDRVPDYVPDRLPDRVPDRMPDNNQAAG